jgi:hypothetical protein
LSTESNPVPTDGNLRGLIFGFVSQERPIVRVDYYEAFNGKRRDELLNGEIFYSLKEAQVVIELWRQDYNYVRPHSAISKRTPMIMFAAHRNTPTGSTVPEALI